VIAPIYRDHRPLPELAHVVTGRCDDVTTIVVTREGVHVDATAVGGTVPWHKRRDALPEDLRLDWPLASKNVVRLRDGLYPLDGDHEQRVLRDVLDRAMALRRAFPAAEGETVSAILTVAEDVPIETTMRTYLEIIAKVDGAVAVATAAGCATSLFPRVADGRARVRVTAVGDRYATTSCTSDAEGKLVVGPERWTAEHVRTTDIGGLPEYCAAPLDKTLDALQRYGAISSRAGEAPIPFVTAARPR
jgi:hypothetical protein